MEREYGYSVAASEGQLDELLVGKEAGFSRPLFHAGTSYGSAGVFWVRLEEDGLDRVRPLAIVAPEDYLRRICGRYAQLHSDLAPLSAWCHLLSPGFFESLEAVCRNPKHGRLEAAWSGLVVAEALLLSERPLSSVRVPTCLATQSFAIARTVSLWSDVSESVVLKRFDLANRLCRDAASNSRAEPKTGRLRNVLSSVWRCLLFMRSDRPSFTGDFYPLVQSLQSLARAREIHDSNEARALAEPLLPYVPEAFQFTSLLEMPPEARLRVFDSLVSALGEGAHREDSGLRRDALAMLAGYLSTVAAGGAPSLGLVENTMPRFPELTAWAYVLGSLGERVVWTSSFDGLGRLVARELGRPFRIDESPMCDFAVDEAAVTVDSQLSDPLVHLRVKQARIATVALFPGVNVNIPLTDTAVEPVKAQTAPTVAKPVERILADLADALLPHLRARLTERPQSGEREQRSGYGRDSNKNKKRKAGGPSRLPLNESTK